MIGRAQEQAKRLAELQSLTQEQLWGLYAAMHNPMGQRKVVQHFDEHRNELEGLAIHSVEAYRVLFQQHVQRNDLRTFTYISSKSPHPRLWSMVGVDNGVVSLYNETRKRHWSLFRPLSLNQYLYSGKGWWIEVIFGGGLVRLEKW